ncbi:hypothetical protein FRC07_012293 [Ceratobasidium sp. 392]|nr:hypothetical protein FRC07_012293 [Ceratobasidium sp. 392]
MAKYTDPITPIGGKTWFTEEEFKWLLAKHYKGYLSLPSGNTKNATSVRTAFYVDICNQLPQVFPYREPSKNKQWTFTPDQKKLAMTDDDRLRLKQRVADKFRNHRKAVQTQAGVSVADASVPSPPKTPTDAEHFGESGAEDATGDEDDAETGGSEALSDMRGFGTRYYTSETDREEMERLLDELKEMTSAHWAAVTEEELREQVDLTTMLQYANEPLIERATAAEIHLTALWHDGKKMQGCSTTTERVEAFGKSNKALEFIPKFIRFVKEHIGPAMSTSILTAAPSVYGDLDRHMRPLLPPEHEYWMLERRCVALYLEYLWVWQGGLLPLPWGQLQEDGDKKHFYLIEQKRLPAGIYSLKNPLLWDERETWLWSTGLRIVDLPDEEAFQFRQPRPNQIEDELRRFMHPDSQLTYMPESLLYMRRRIMQQGIFPEEWQGLPPIPPEEHRYKPFTQAQMGDLWKAVTGFDALKDLIDYTLYYETLGPYQATSRDWEHIACSCKPLDLDLPSPSVGLEHVVRVTDHNGPQLPPEFFDVNAEDHYCWELSFLRRWIAGGALMHKSGSLMGGPRGVKLLVLLLVYLYSSGTKIRLGTGPRYDGIDAEWTKRDQATLAAIVDEVQVQFNQSFIMLTETQSQRETAGKGVKNRKEPVFVWNEKEINISIPSRMEDEWTRREMKVTDGLVADGDQARGRKKRTRRDTGDVEGQVAADGEYSGNPVLRKKSKSNSSDVGLDEDDMYFGRAN